MNLKRTAIAIAVVTALAVGAAAQARIVTGEWEPFTGAKLPGQGIATEIVAAACKAGGIEFKLEFFPWPRAESMVQDGTAFATYPYALNDERKAKYDFSDSMFLTGPKFIYTSAKLDGVKATKLADLTKYRVIVLAGNFSEKALKDAGIKVDTANNMESAVKMLEAGRADFWLEEPTAAFDSIGKLFPDKIDSFKVADMSLFPLGTNHLMVSRAYTGSKDLLAKFNAGLKTIKANGTLDALAKKYRLVVK